MFSPIPSARKEAFGESVFGDVGDAGGDRVAHASQGDVLAFNADAPRVEGASKRTWRVRCVRAQQAH